MIELQDSLPKELEETLNSLDYAEDGSLLITAFEFKEEDLEVDFTLSFGGIDRPKQLWRIDIKGVEKKKIVVESANYPEIYLDHYLLYEFNDNYVELYYNGKADNSEKLFLDLYQLHQANFTKLDFGIDINAPDGMLKLCQREMGLFARGPKKILEQYAKCLVKHSVQPNLLEGKEREISKLKLLIFGESYFVGESFEFTKLPT